MQDILQKLPILLRPFIYHQHLAVFEFAFIERNQVKVKEKMGSSARKKDVKVLLDVGKKLFARPSAIDELLVLLEKAESILRKVGQQPPKSIEVALIPLMKALISDELLRNHDANIQIAVACCFNELTRISAPKFTYDDAKMKEFFQLCMIVLKHLSGETGLNYDRALRMLESFAKLKSCLILLDIDCDALVVEMFQLFFNTMRFNPSAATFTYMETIINLVIQESDEISFELLKPLLDSVKMDNKNISYISWELGNAVFKNCSDKLHNPLKEVVMAMNLDVRDYAEIITSLCQRTSSSDKRDDYSQNVENGERSTLDGENSLETLNRCEQIVKLKTYNANEVVYVSERETEYFQRRRGTKPSMRKPEDGYVCKHQEKDIGVSVEGNLSRGGWKKKKKRVINQQNTLEPSTMLRKKSLQTKGARSVLGSGKGLVDLRIKVWWPDDKEYYPGTIVSFDHLTNKHKVVYNDGDIEILNMDEEIWELWDDQNSEKQEADPPAPAKEPARTITKKTRRKPGPSKKHNATSSSKRLKGEKCGGHKSGEVSSHVVGGVKDEPDCELHEFTVLLKNDGTNSAENTETDTPPTEKQPSHGITLDITKE